jgi:spore coat protein U-like protein
MTNKFGKWSGLAGIITAGLVLSGASSFAADNVILSGEVAPVNTIAVVGFGTYATLDLTASPTALKVAVATEISNDAEGYTVGLKADSAVATGVAKLKGIDAAANTLTYSIKYNDVAVVLDETTGIDTDVFNANAPTDGDGVNHDITIAFAGGAWLPSDVYSDTLTLTITAK